jgi:transcriptional regulator with XRE-family HTH domain
MGVRPRIQSLRLAAKLLRIREALGLSQNEMLHRLGMSDVLIRQNISSYEKGRNEPPLPVLLRYAKVAGVCVDVLIDDTLELPRKLPSTPEHRTAIR